MLAGFLRLQILAGFLRVYQEWHRAGQSAPVTSTVRSVHSFDNIVFKGSRRNQIFAATDFCGLTCAVKRPLQPKVGAKPPKLNPVVTSTGIAKHFSMIIDQLYVAVGMVFAIVDAGVAFI